GMPAGRDRTRHGPISERCPSGLLGWHVPGQQRECWQATQRTDGQGEPLAAADAGPSRLGGEPHEEDLFGGSISPAYSASRRQACVDGGGTFDLVDCLPDACERHDVFGTWRGLLRPPQLDEAHTLLRQTP